MSNTIKFETGLAYNLKEIHDLIKFVESDGGKKLLEELKTTAEIHLAILENAAKQINSENKDKTYSEILENRGSYTAIANILRNYLDLKLLDGHYSTLFKLDSAQPEEQPIQG